MLSNILNTSASTLLKNRKKNYLKWFYIFALKRRKLTRASTMYCIVKRNINYSKLRKCPQKSLVCGHNQDL